MQRTLPATCPCRPYSYCCRRQPLTGLMLCEAREGGVGGVGVGGGVLVERGDEDEGRKCWRGGSVVLG